ncbi:hypothetical protein M758_2G191100 [Ceratodon purpureus]|nr:hypothetical protein M758_2G191100 [Ceratodon purpureus]
MAESSRKNLSSLFSSGTIPKGWSEKELEVYEKITGVPPDKPRPLVVIMDLGEHHHDLAMLVILKELHRLGFIALQAVVATTKFQNSFDYKPAYHEQARACSARARLARAALNSLDLSHIPVAQGRLRSCASGRDGSTDLALRDGERGPDLDELRIDQLLDRQLEICGIVEYIESDSTMVQHLHHGSGQDLRLQVHKSGQDLLLKVYGDAKEKGEKLHVLCLPSLQDIHEFSTTFTNPVAEWTAEVYVGTVSNTQLKRQNREVKLDSTLELFHFSDGEMSEEWHSFLSKHRIPSNYYSILTRSSSQMAWKKTLNDLVSIGHHPIIAYLCRTAARYSTRVDNMLTDVLAAIGAAGPHVQAATGVSKLQDDHCYPKIEDSIEEKLELAMSSLLKGFLLDATSETLCDFCGSVNFGAVGYNKPQKSAGVKLNDNERTNRPIRDILQNVKCIFCRVVAKSFHDWSRGKFDMQAFDLQNDSNEACYEMVRLHGKDKDSSDNKLTRIKVGLKVFTYERVAYCVTLEFQACSKPLQDSAYNPQPEEAYHGRIRPLYADIGLFKRWIRDCCNNPGPHPHCGKGTYKDKTGQCIKDQTGEFMGLDGLRLIDVERMCVVDVQNDVSYTALSYVWGEYNFKRHRKIMPKLTTENRVFFQQAGTLRRVMLPRTIADAIELTKRLGFAYIWIDCLCIVQGDEMDERYFIPQMDVIFGCAVFTIH